MPHTSSTNQATIDEYVIKFSCPDQLGIVGRFGNFMHQQRAFITEVENFADNESQLFFSRNVFDTREMNCSIQDFSRQLEDLASDLRMDYLLRPKKQQHRVLIAVSKYDHCLAPLLTKWHSKTLDIDIVGVVSNHQDCRAVTEFYNLPYFYLPISQFSKAEQEAAFEQIIIDQQADLTVLARYMQILSDDFCSRYPGKIINIHHSFLPSFKGAKPYHQAYKRGVKVIGATAHYVTADLDEGPIIVQEVKPINHRYSAQQMVYAGHDIEATALADAVRLHCEDRVFLNGQKTVIL